MTMPAGTYYIGDLCYVMHDVWGEFCELTTEGHSCLDGEFILKDGRRFATYSTMYGDGDYPVSTGGRVGVDAGLVGCILLDEIADEGATPETNGVIVKFTQPFETGSDEGGTIYFGHVRVRTGRVRVRTR